MKKNKEFDCVEMKNAIQAKIRKENEGLSDEEIARRRREWLETSDDPLAQWWRSLAKSKSTELSGGQRR
jgi:hypothetical protein